MWFCHDDAELVEHRRLAIWKVDLGWKSLDTFIFTFISLYAFKFGSIFQQSSPILLKVMLLGSLHSLHLHQDNINLRQVTMAQLHVGLKKKKKQ